MKLHYLKRGIAVTWAWNILLVRVACAGVGWGLWGGDLGEYCDLCVHGGVLLRGGVVGGFRGIWLGVWELGSAHFLAAPGGAGVGLHVFGDLDMLLVGRVQRRGLSFQGLSCW